MSGLVQSLVDEPLPMVPAVQQNLAPNMMQQAHSDYGFAIDAQPLPDPPNMHRSFFAKLLSMVTDHSVAQRVAQFPMVQRYTEGITSGASGLPYVLDIALNTETLCVYKPFLPDGQSYYDVPMFPVYFCFAGTHTAWDALRAAVLTASGNNYDTHFDAFKVSIVAYVTANAALFPNNRPIHLLGFSMGATAAIWCQTVLSQLWPNREVYATVFNPYVGHLTLASNTGKRGRDTNALNQWHQDRLQYLQSHTIAADHFVWRVTSNCIVGEDGSKYWADFDEHSEPLFWGRCYMFDPLFDDGSGVSASFPLGQRHTIKQWTGQISGTPITTDAGPEVIETPAAEIVAGLYKITGHLIHGVTVPSGNIHTSLVLTAQTDPAHPSTMIQYPSTQFMDDTALTAAQYTALGQTFGVVPNNVDGDEYTVHRIGDPTVMQPLQCIIKAVTGAENCFTLQRASDGQYMESHIIGSGGSYTLADKNAVNWQSEPADTSLNNMNYLGLIWKFSPMGLADSDPTHQHGPRRAIQPELYDILPQDGTSQNYTIKFVNTDNTRGSAGETFTVSQTYTTQTRAVEMVNSFVPSAWTGWTIDPDTTAPDEQVFTVSSLSYLNNLVSIVSTLPSASNGVFGQALDTNNPLDTNVLTHPAHSFAWFQITDFTYVSATSFTCKLRSANKATNPYYKFVEPASSANDGTTGWYGSMFWSNQADAVTLTFDKI